MSHILSCTCDITVSVHSVDVVYRRLFPLFIYGRVDILFEILIKTIQSTKHFDVTNMDLSTLRLNSGPSDQTSRYDMLGLHTNTYYVELHTRILFDILDNYIKFLYYSTSTC